MAASHRTGVKINTCVVFLNSVMTMLIGTNIDAETQVDKSKVKLIFTIMGHQLHLNTKCLDIDAELHRILSSWQMNDFQELEMNAPNEWDTAMDAANSRIELLERRLRGWNL